LSARSSAFPEAARSQHENLVQRYAPRPFRFPVGSIWTPSFGVLTTRTNCRFASFSRQTTQVRSGTCFGRGPLCLGRAPMLSGISAPPASSRSCAAGV
jgi:hypothetical protein